MPLKVMPTGERVAKAFADESARAYGDKYLDHLLTRRTDLGRDIRRAVSLVALLAVSFALLAGAKEAQLTLGPIKLTNVAGVLTLVPALLAYLYYEFMALMLVTHLYNRLISATFKSLYPGLYEQDLEVPLAPTTMQPWGYTIASVLRENDSSRWSDIDEALGTAHGVAIHFGAIIFLVYAYWRLFSLPTANDVAVGVSLAFAAVNALRGILMFADWNASYDRRDASATSG